MVEYLEKINVDLNIVFDSLSDPTRRDILRRVAKKVMSVGEVAEPYRLTFAAVSKHLRVLQKAKLIEKRREGNHQYVALSPLAMKEASEYLKQYQIYWEERFSRLDKILKKEFKNKKRYVKK